MAKMEEDKYEDDFEDEEEEDSRSFKSKNSEK